jgi:hypothetical protein
MALCEPWAFAPKIPPGATQNKGAFCDWEAEAGTEHLFYTASEGLNAAMRTSKLNPIRNLHGLIADYDCPGACLEMASGALSKQPTENRPNWLSRTFSGGGRLVWLFEEPIPMENVALTKAFLVTAAADLKIKKFLPGLDEPAWKELHKIYEVGTEWTPLNRSPLPTFRIFAMLEKASRKVLWRKEGVSIPLGIVAEEVDKRFPGRWHGEFKEGARGCAFFDPDSTNPTASIVTETGMVCFSKEKTFYRWIDIFGAEFVRKYEEDRIGAAAADTYYDGRQYWSKSEGGIWEASGKDDYVIRLKVLHRIHATKERLETCSEADRVLSFIHENRRVSGAVPRIYGEEDLLHYNGRKFVNCAAVKVIQPAESAQTWGEDFPWIAQFLDTCWSEKLVPCVKEGVAPARAKDIFLAWFQRFYVSARQGDVLKGHALFLVGGVNLGKTLLSLRIVGDAMGGGSEASDFLLSESHFNRELMHVGVWNIDDGSVNADPRVHQKFSDMVKRAVANPNMSYHAKHQDQQRVEWNGRIVTTLNDDASSISMLPTIGCGVEDKIIVLKFSDGERAFPAKPELEKTISGELPYFLRWLIDWETPKEIVGPQRFGIHAFIDQDTREAALNSGGVGDLLELVQLWIRRSGEKFREDGETVWKGTATAWMAEVAQDEMLKPLIMKFNPRQLGRKFTEASKSRSSGISVGESKYKGDGNRYSIFLGPSKVGKSSAVKHKIEATEQAMSL